MIETVKNLMDVIKITLEIRVEDDRRRLHPEKWIMSRNNMQSIMDESCSKLAMMKEVWSVLSMTFKFFHRFDFNDC